MATFAERREGRTALAARLPAGTLVLASVLALPGVQRLHAQSLPEAPSALLAATRLDGPSAFATPDGPQTGPASPAQPPPLQRRLPRCPPQQLKEAPEAGSSNAAAEQVQTPCRQEDPLQPIVNAYVGPLTVRQKGILAFRDVIDPFNLITIAGSSAITVAAQSHSAYGPGFRGFGKLSGYSLSEDVLGESVGTFAIPSLVHEDPRYHRMPGRPFPRRLLHAVAHTFVSQHDDGRTMPNYAILLTYPLAAEIFDLYVPGTSTDLPSTAKRVGVGLATNPAGDILAEFLPDLARRVHVRIVFVQQIMNQVAAGAPGTL